MALLPNAKLRRQRLLLLLACLIVPTSLSIYLLVQAAFGSYFSPSSARWVEQNRASIQIIIQIASMVLGTLQVYAISCVLAMSFNIRMQSTTTSLDELKLWDALRQGRFDWDLPRRWMALLGLYVSLIHVPSALWAGAITPVLVRAEIAADYAIPQYSERTATYWGTPCPPGYDCSKIQPQKYAKTTTELGTFTYIGWKYRTGLLLNSVNQASSRNSSLPQIGKLDNTGYVYNGRSYGVASAVGLTTPNLTSLASGTENADITEFSYHESGYQAHVECAYNASSALKIIDTSVTWQQADSSLWATGFWVNGSLPNGIWTGFPVWGGNNMTILAIAASADQGRHVYGLVAGNYLDKVQCEVTFIPDTFEVAVNQVFKNISVAPSGQAPIPADIDASGNLADVAFLCPSYLSQVLTTGYTSVLSGAFDTNIDNVRARENHTEGSTTSDVLAGVSEGLESLLDHCLGSLGAAQQIVVDDTQTVKANATINVVKLGEPKVVAGLLGVSVAILVLLGLEAIKSKFWRNLTLFNSLDLKSAILGVVATRSKTELLTTWNGDSSDRKTGSIRVAIAANKRGLEVLLDDTEHIDMPYAPETARISAEPLLETKPGSVWFKFHST